MELNIRAGMRVLFKWKNSNWKTGYISEGSADVEKDGLYIPIITKSAPEEEGCEAYQIEINDIFFDAIKLDDWIKDYPQYFMTKEDYIKLTEEEDFDRQRENAYVTDGEYIYYPVSKFSKSWIEKQPFDYIVRSDL